MSTKFKTQPANVGLEILGQGRNWIKVQWKLLRKGTPVTHHTLRIEESDPDDHEPNGIRQEFKIANVQYGDIIGMIQRSIRDLESGRVFYVSVLTYYKTGSYIQSDVKPVATLTAPPGRILFSENTDTSFRMSWTHPPTTRGTTPQGYYRKFLKKVKIF